MYKELEMPVIGISGKIGSGKDTVADILIENFHFLKRSFAYGLKKKAMDDFDLTKDQVYDPALKEITILEYGKSPREILQLMGTEWYRSIDPNYWVKSLYKELSFHFFGMDTNMAICIPDVRFPNEFDFIDSIGGMNIRVVRPEYSQSTHTAHASETALDDIDILTIVNDGTLEELKVKVLKFIEDYFPKITLAKDTDLFIFPRAGIINEEEAKKVNKEKK